MSPKTYDVSMLVGIACCTGSAYLSHGPVRALAVFGALVLVSTIAGAALAVAAAKD